MAKEKVSAYENFISKAKNALSGRRKAANFDYYDADGQVVLQTEGEEDNLAEGVTATLASGDASGVVILDDGREVTVDDNVVTKIEDTNSESLEERVEELEGLLEEATNVATEQHEQITTQNARIAELETELRNYKGSDHTPKNRKGYVPTAKSKQSAADNRSVEDIKADSREKRKQYNQGSLIK